MALGDACDDAKPFKIEKYLEGSFVVFEDIAGLLDKIAELKDDVLVIVHVADELLDKGA